MRRRAGANGDDSGDGNSGVAGLYFDVVHHEDENKYRIFSVDRVREWREFS